MGTVEVYILGQNYTIKGDAPEEYIRKLAAHVNDRLNEVYQKTPGLSPVKASILTAISIADELYRLKEEYGLIATIEEKASVLANLFD